MKKLLICIMCLLPISAAYAETANDAFRALKRLEAKCQSGISYKDFSLALGYSKFTLNMYLEEKDPSKSSSVTKSMLIAYDHYEFAKTMWDFKFTSKMEIIPTTSDWGIDLSKIIFSRYPEANRSTTDGGVIYKSTLKLPDEAIKAGIKLDDDIYLDGVVSYAFNKASSELKTTASLLPSDRNAGREDEAQEAESKDKAKTKNKAKSSTNR
jgi:hypothetical protein